MGKRRLSKSVAAAAVAIVLLAGGTCVALQRAGTLAIREIAVTGNVWLARGDVLALLDGLYGRNVVTVDLERWRETLLGSPWVADVSIRRALPGTIAIAITEREPMALASIGGALYLIDREARLIDLYGPRYAALDLPIVDGLASAAGGAIDEARAALAAQVLSDLERRPDLAAYVSQIDIVNPREAAILLKGDTTRVRIGNANAADRLQTYVDIVDALRAQVPDIDYVDLRFDERVFVGPRPTRGDSGEVRRSAAPRVRGGRG